MKNRLFKRAVLSLITVFLLLPMLLSLPLQALALEQPEQDPEFTQWTLSEDGNTLSNGETTYTRYWRDHPNFGLLMEDSQTTYTYANEIRHPDAPTITLSIHAISAESEYVWLNVLGVTYIYATEAGAVELDRLLELDYTLGYLTYVFYTPVDTSFYSDLQNHIKATTPITVNVTRLAECDSYNLQLFEREDGFKMEAGAFYKIDGVWHYVDYIDLGNEYFDSYGSFSYRRGKVSAYPVSDEYAAVIEDAQKNTKERPVSYTREDDDAGWEFPIALFWIYFSFLGYVIPLPFLIVGLILPMIKKLGRPKYWYTMAGLAALWMLLAAALMILMIVA